VFAAMLASATRICEAEFGNLFLREEQAFRAVAWHGEPTYVNTWRGDAVIIKTDVPDIPLARLVITKQRVHVADLRQEATYKAGFAPLVALVDKGGARTLLIVPMLKDELWSAQSPSIVRKFAPLPTSRPRRRPQSVVAHIICRGSKGVQRSVGILRASQSPLRSNRNGRSFSAFLRSLRGGRNPEH
jgi:hypothetical protein